MNYIVKLFCIVIWLFSSVLHASQSPDELFEHYNELAVKFDPSLGSLYFDDAKIHAYRIYPHGLERVMEFSGVKWKNMMPQIMRMSGAKNDISRYSNIVISNLESGYKIKADRYSELKCYTDTGYFMIVKPNANGELLIAEEYFETKPMPDCR